MWQVDPGSRPPALLGCAGPLTHRYIPGAVLVDRDVLCDEPVREVTAVNAGLDAFDLRGRRVVDMKFGRGEHQHFMWVDGAGSVRYGETTGWALVGAA